MDEKKQNLDPYLQKLLNFEPFLELFWQYCKDYSTQEQAYEAAERLFFATFGKRKYADFESFRQVRNRYLKKNCNNVTVK